MTTIVQDTAAAQPQLIAVCIAAAQELDAERDFVDIDDVWCEQALPEEKLTAKESVTVGQGQTARLVVRRRPTHCVMHFFPMAVTEVTLCWGLEDVENAVEFAAATGVGSVGDQVIQHFG